MDIHPIGISSISITHLFFSANTCTYIGTISFIITHDKIFSYIKMTFCEPYMSKITSNSCNTITLEIERFLRYSQKCSLFF